MSFFSLFQINYDEMGRVHKDPPPMHARPKHPYKVHAWAGISKRGATRLRLFTGCMDSDGYVDILEVCVYHNDNNVILN